MHRLISVSAAAMALAFAAPAFSQDASQMDRRLESLFGDYSRYETFFGAMQQAIADDDRDAVAAMARYPLEVHREGETLVVDDARGFETRYGEIITDGVREAVADQTYERLLANWKGVMVGRGEIWFSGICDDADCEDATVKIIAVNVPPSENPAADPATGR